MRDELAKHVHPVLLHGLRLKERLKRGERPNLASEQATLKGLLGSPNQPAPWGGGSDPLASMDSTRYLGARYAVTCWLDEILIDSPWEREWDENKLEQALFHTNIRYSNFWAQARLAEGIPGSSDAQEVYLLCVLLGFRGEVGERSEQLREWVTAARSRASRGMGKELPPVPEKTPESNVPVLLGVDGYQRMVKTLSIGMLVLAPILTFLLITWFR
ncbi:MAG: DotU family type IV/VI secretion system protein [Planctomycetes bacterium]|nr:DotU family type IV/VI secretion system protein [Planctomycetota bacterium]